MDKVARRKNEPNLIILDHVVNGKEPGIDWTKVDPAYTDYQRVLDSVDGMVDVMPRYQSTRMSEVKLLRELAQGVIDYRFNLPNSAELAPIIAKWKSIVSNLDEIQSDTSRFRPDSKVIISGFLSDNPKIDLYKDTHEYHPYLYVSSDEFKQGPSIFFNF